MIRSSARPQRGATLIIGLIMLLLITLLVVAESRLSNVNIASVGNAQYRQEAISAANAAIEQLMMTNFTQSPSAQSLNVDLNQDGSTDYVVNFLIPVCVSSAQVPVSAQAPSSLSLGTSFYMVTNFFRTVWELQADVVDVVTGTTVRIHQGVRVTLNQTQLNLVCPPPL